MKIIINLTWRKQAKNIIVYRSQPGCMYTLQKWILKQQNTLLNWLKFVGKTVSDSQKSVFSGEKFIAIG